MALSESTGIKEPRRKAQQRHYGLSTGAQSLSLDVVGQNAPHRGDVEQSIMHKFEASYGAHLSHFLPNLIRLGVSEDVGAVAGVNFAQNNSLFLEQYLDRPVEQAIGAAFMTPVDRDQLVEIGNLAANVPGLAYSLFAILATVLSKAGFKWVVCTATPQVALMLAKLEFAAQPLCDADPSKLESGSADWGAYYASRPRVMAGDAHLAAAQAASNPDLALPLQHYRQPIERLAASLGRERR